MTRTDVDDLKEIYRLLKQGQFAAAEYKLFVVLATAQYEHQLEDAHHDREEKAANESV